MKSNECLYFTTFRLSRINFKIFATKKGIHQIHLNDKSTTPNAKKAITLQQDDPYFFDIYRQLDEYFKRERNKFDIPLDLSGTDFQLKVWKELSKIPFGKVMSYKEIAGKVGGSSYVRAVGRANSQNPVPIIIPCHRVIESGGRLGGYSGGIEIKEKLLELEGSLSLKLFQ
ncbi:MAG TPA: methylated-DNA--[protein]-cysteine S-methyltransferase [Ignavibacteriaceae bacterium]|nr:methylated-DNA--[protein]-cysteine S-methyltransferase [Ignavibacteriaceae bacterium]